MVVPRAIPSLLVPKHGSYFEDDDQHLNVLPTRDPTGGADGQRGHRLASMQ